jgi:MFS family permease
MLAGLAWALIIIHPLPMLSNMTDASRLGTYTGLYYLFTSLAAIAGPNLNGLLVQLSGGNYNTVMLFSAVLLGVAWGLMWGVRREGPGVGRPVARVEQKAPIAEPS